MRVAALRDIGCYQGHLTEDLATGMRFHVGRWESVYVPEPLAVGEGPTTWAAYFNQQYRWAFGCMNIFFTTHWPKVNLRMRITHAIYYFLMEQFYFSGLTMATAVLLIMIYWLQRFNIQPKLERGFSGLADCSPLRLYRFTSWRSSCGAGSPRSCCWSSRFPACAGGWLVRCAGSEPGLASLNPSLNRRHVCFALLRWLSKTDGG